jgi:PAS domain S-box-containing protein
MVLERMYRDLVESSPDGIWVIDLTGRTLYANPSLARMYGVTVEEMRDVTVFDTLDARGRRDFRAHLEDVRAGNLNDDAQECLFHRKDGTSQWLLVQESPYRDEHGELVGVAHRLFDYSRRREMTQALEDSRRQLAEAQRIARVGSYWWDVVADEITVSDQLVEIFEMPDPAFPVSYEEFLEFTHPDDRAGVDEAVRQTLRTGERFTFLARVGEEERGWIWARGRGVGRCAADGTVLALEGTLQNVTETVEQEQALRDQVAQNRLMQAVASAANEASSLEEVLAQAKHLVLLHDDWRRARGFSHREGELVPIYLEEADRLPDLEDPELLESDLRLARKVLAARDLVWDEARLTVAFPVFVKDELMAVLAITSDPPLYRHQMIEDFVRQVAAQLSQVALRELTTRHMEEARDAAMAASQQKSDFLAMVSHEIRTPLNGVIGLNELLLQTDLDEEQRKLATGAGLSGRLLLSLINDILDFSKIEAGQLRLERLDFHVREMFEQLLGAQGESAEQKGVVLEARYDDALPEVLCGDPTRVAQVVNNLVSNAVKFTDEGSVVVRVSADRDGGQWLLRCEVEDTGIGIDPAVEDLFEPFKQADTSTSRRFGGTGLGLAISRELVTLAGGEIGYDSAPGRGSTFWFTMRMEGPSGRPALGRPTAPSLQAHGPSRRILLVEDNPVNRMVAVGMLQALGHETDSAEDGIVALGLLQEHRYDAVLLDVQMPRMDGYATARAIREGERHSGAPRLPIIALTAAAIDGERERCLQAGMDDFLTKPLAPNGLSAALRRWLGGTDEGDRRWTADVDRSAATLAPVEAEQPPHLDLDRLRMLRDLVPGSTAYLDRALDNFLRNSAAAEETLRRAVADGDARAVGFHAHTLKGSAANLGLAQVAEVAELLQRIGDSRDLEGAEVLLTQLRDLLRTGRDALRKQRASAYADLATTEGPTGQGVAGRSTVR